MTSGSLNLLNLSGPVQACIGIALIFLTCMDIPFLGDYQHEYHTNYKNAKVFICN